MLWKRNFFADISLYSFYCRWKSYFNVTSALLLELYSAAFSSFLSYHIVFVFIFFLLLTFSTNFLCFKIITVTGWELRPNRNGNKIFFNLHMINVLTWPGEGLPLILSYHPAKCGVHRLYSTGNITFLNCHVITWLGCHVKKWGAFPHLKLPPC